VSFISINVTAFVFMPMERRDISKSAENSSDVIVDFL